MVEAGAGGHDRCRIIPLGQADKRMVSATQEQWAIDQRTQPGQDGFQKGADQILDERRHSRQIAGATPQDWWYNGHSNRLPVTEVDVTPRLCHRWAVGTSVRNNYPKLSAGAKNDLQKKESTCCRRLKLLWA